MTEDGWEDVFAQMLDARVAGESPPGYDFDAAHASEVIELLNVADLLWEAAHGAPPVERDPVAAMLGLVPDSARSLDGNGLKRALRGAGLQVSSLAQALSARGWDVATRDVFNWQTRDNPVAPPALIQAIAEITGVTPEQLTIDRGASPPHVALASVTSSRRFRELAERWARLRRTSVDLGASALNSRLAALVFRGVEPDETQMLDSLEALIVALESEPGSDESD
ncbi:hypothetical protein [Frankia sp. KB5]|uniref:hypothetical protein n=1 Tax=Frankia sp. KB5 TaxID=683318 RepID=UPI00105478FE|nr:hypothetical protein [Frankia sp. KB5]